MKLGRIALLAVVAVTYNGETLPALLSRLLQRDKPSEMQMQAAKWYLICSIHRVYVHVRVRVSMSAIE